ncbi:MAG TPA: hypothetical protein VMY87_03205 [Armatimonadota bacterium]|nr:hypothetical protein [Armatimonadota bacterium]
MQFEPWRSQLSVAPRAHWDPLVWDGIAQYYPWRLFAAESLREGALPLWNPYQFCGTPFVANGQSAVFYPLNLLFWLLPVARAFAWSAWLHLALTGWFAYLFLRRVGTAPLGALAGAVIWQGNGFFVAWMHLPTVLCTAAWLPLILLLCERALRRGRAREAAAAGAALGLCSLAGHPHIFLLVALFAAAFIMSRGLSRDLGVGVAEGLRRLLVTGAVSGLVGAGLAAVQLLPTLALLRIAHRTFTPDPESYRAFLSHAVPPLQLFGLVLPHAFGHPALGSYAGRDNYAEMASYVGIVALGLALWGAVASRRWHGRFFAAALALALLVVLGTPANWPLYQWVPGIARSGGPGRFLLLVVFSLAMLGGMGAETVLGRVAGREARLRIGFAALLLALGGVALLWWSIGIPALAEIRSTIISLAQVEIVRAILLVAVAVVLVLLPPRASLRGLARGGFVVILAADLLLAAQHHLHISPVEWVYPPVPIATVGEGRVVGNAKDWPIDRFPIAALPPNSAMVYHLRDAFGYDSLYLARYRDFAAAVQHGDPSPPLNGNMLLARLGPVYGLDMMSLAGVETVLSAVPVRGLKMERAGGYYTYSNPYAWPRAWIADSAVFVSTHREATVRLAQLGLMPDCVIVTGADLPADERRPGASAAVVVRDSPPNAVEIDLPQGGGGYLFLADSYAPGWRAYADGLQLHMRPANVAFRTVAPPQDAKQVTFRYEPDSFRVGLFVTLLAVAAMGAVGGFSLLVRSG